MKVPVRNVFAQFHNGWWIGTTDYRIGPDRPLSAQMRGIQENMRRFNAAINKMSFGASKGRRNG